MSDTQFDDEILDSNAISPTDEEGNPVPVTIPIALAPGVTVVYTTRLGGVSHGDFGDCNLGGKGGDFIGAKEQLLILRRFSPIACRSRNPSAAGSRWSVRCIPGARWTWMHHGI